MNQITHEQAQTYLHLAADGLLHAKEMALLDAHLLNCATCRDYAEEFTRLESALRTTLRRRWDGVPVRVPMDRILGRAPASPLRRALSVAATPALLTFLVLLAVTLTRGPISGGSDTATPSATIVVTSAPTPSVEQSRAKTTIAVPSSSTNRVATITDACEPLIYTVQPGDTLADIAKKFGVSVEAIREANRITADIITDKIIIPVCNPTPGNTLTYTPPFTPTSYIP